MLFYGKIRSNSIEFDPKDENEWNLFCAANQNRKVYIDIGFETRQRTEKQNNALWLGLTMLADALNQAGLDMKKVLKENVDIQWTKDSAKEYLFAPIIHAKYGKKSTTELTKEEISEAWQ